MRILFVCSSMGIGGAEKLTAVLANEFIQKGNECAIFIIRSNKRETLHLLYKIIKIYDGELKRKFNFRYLFKLNKSVKNFNPDVILCESKLSYISIKLARLFSKKHRIFLAIHGYFNYSKGGKIITKLAFFFIRNSADRVIVTFEKQIEKLMSEYSVSQDKFVLIPNGIDTDYYDIRNLQNVQRVDDKLRILYIGNFRPEKDQWTLMNGMKILNESTQNWELMFRGEIPQEIKSEFIDFCEKNGFGEKINFVGFVEDPRFLFKNVDVFALTSISEALPMSAIEATSMSIPCILTDVGGCSDIVEDGKNGFIIEPNNPEILAKKLLFLVYNKTLLKKMKNHARKKALINFKLDVTVEKYLETVR